MARQQQDMNSIFAKYLANRSQDGASAPKPASASAQPAVQPTTSKVATSCQKPGGSKKLIIIVVAVIALVLVMFIIFKFIQKKRKASQA